MKILRKKKKIRQTEVKVGQIWIFEYGETFGIYQRTFKGLIIGPGAANDVIKSWRVWDLDRNEQLNAADGWFDSLEMFTDAEFDLSENPDTLLISTPKQKEILP